MSKYRAEHIYKPKVHLGCWAKNVYVSHLTGNRLGGALRPPCGMAGTWLPGRVVSEKAQPIWIIWISRRHVDARGGSDCPRSRNRHDTAQTSCMTSPKDPETLIKMISRTRVKRYNTPNTFTTAWFPERGWLEHWSAIQPTSGPPALCRLFFRLAEVREDWIKMW